MTILIKIIRFLRKKVYQRRKRKKCSKCGILNWKYFYTPYIKNNEKGVIEARICGHCGNKDKLGTFLSDKLQIDKNTKFEVKK